MGTVYRAVHPEIGSEVAIKVLSGNWSGSGAPTAERFLQEARAASRVRHLNIVQIFALGNTDGGGLYYVMELLDGHNLRTHLGQHGAFPVGDAVTVVNALASALDALHAAKVIHRDLKPGNVFLVRPDLGINSAQIKLLDFGVARLQDPWPGAEVQTASGMLLGTPAYMSPEQCRGQEVDQRSDIYSLGVIAFELFSGQRPFGAKSVGDMAIQQQADQRHRLHDLVANLPVELEVIVARALHLEPSARYQSAGDLARELAQACGRPISVESSPVPLRPPLKAVEGETVSLAVSSSKRFLWVALVLAVLVAVVTVVNLAMWWPDSPQPAAKKRAVAADAAVAKKEPAPDAAPTAEAKGPAKTRPRPRRRRARRRKTKTKKDRVVRGLPVRF
jgi:serine/threonine-protein kinase